MEVPDSVDTDQIEKDGRYWVCVECRAESSEHPNKINHKEYCSNRNLFI